MTPADSCATCRYWMQSHLEHHQGEGVCAHLASGPRQRKADFVRPLYVAAAFWCQQHEEPVARSFELRPIQ
jgi:hypothetical protein